MKVVLIQPPIEDFYLTKIRNYPLGLLQIGSNIKNISELRIFNARNGGGKIIENEEFKGLEIYFSKNKISPFSLFKGYKYYGKNENQIKNFLEKEKPQIIGISSSFSAHFKEVLKLSKFIKKILPDSKIVLGGCHPTFFPEDVLKNKEIDFVIRGEGETPFKVLIENLKKGNNFPEYRGICYKKNENILIEDINFEEDTDYIPERDLIDKREFKWAGSFFSQILTSRGCPFSCGFCGKVKSVFRKRSIKSLEEEIDYLNKENIKTLSLEDEVLGLDQKFFREVLNLFKGKGFKLYCMNGIYLEILKKELLEEMFSCGFQKLNLSFVDISEKTLKYERRPFSENFIKFEEIEDFPLNYEIHFILGLPRQRVKDILEIIFYLSQKRALLAPSVYYLAPFSLDFEKYYKGEEFKYFRSSALHSPNPEFPPSVLYTFLVISRFINFIKEKIDRYKIKEIGEIKDLLKSDLEKNIFEKVLKEKKFYYYDRNSNDFIQEPVDKEITEIFLERLKKIKIKGYKSNLFASFSKN